MAQASQQLPSWLTLSSTLVTEPDGSVSTSFTTLRLPLTYFGPSIPLGTDGVWTYGGLTPPPSTTTGSPSATPSTTQPPSVSTTPLFTSTPAPTSLSSSGNPTSASTSSSRSPTSTTSSTSVPGALSGGHGLSTTVLGAILGSILGVLLLIVIILTLLLLRRNRRRSRMSTEGDNTGTSSFWNRQTTLFTLPFRRSDSRRQTPIWTGWEFVEPGGSEGSRGSRNGGREAEAGHHTPGDGSPRGSGEEADPFLTRRSIHSGTLADETQTKSETLVSVPAAAMLGAGTPRTSPRGGHIVPRDVLARTMAEQESSAYDIRVVEPSPSHDHSPLLPPPPLDPDGLAAFGARSRGRPISDRSLASEKGKDQSIHSEKSIGSLETDPAELLVARRVRVGDLAPSHSRLATIESVGEPSTPRSSLGLSGLGARLGRLSWFRRMSTTPSPAAVQSAQETTTDPYTRTPPRSSRHGSHSRPGSWTRLLDDADIESGVPTIPVSPTPATGRDSALGLGLLTTGSRPMSSVSARSAASTGGNTVYHSARSRPASSYVEFPEPVTAPEQQRRLAQSPPGENAAFDGPPPAYDARISRSTRGNRPPSEIDILDIPAPSPVSPFVGGRPAFPPGLVALPQPRTWRDSYGTDVSSPTNSSGVGIAIDILDDEPPAAREGWRDLASERDGRRRTFGVPTVMEQPEPTSSQYPSLHSLPSQAHLRPEGSNSDSAPSTNHSQGGSASSRPSVGSHLREASSAQSLGTSSDESRHEVGVIRSPHLSAVIGSFGSMQQASRPASRGPRPMPPPSYVTPASSRAPLLGGTVTSATSTNTNTNSSVTTALTDPITGAVMHFPSLPWSRGTEQPTIRRVESRGFDEDPSGEEHW